MYSVYGVSHLNVGYLTPEARLGRALIPIFSGLITARTPKHPVSPTHPSQNQLSGVTFHTLLLDMECESSFKGRGKRSSLPLSKPETKNTTA